MTASLCLLFEALQTADSLHEGNFNSCILFNFIILYSKNFVKSYKSFLTGNVITKKLSAGKVDLAIYLVSQYGFISNCCRISQIYQNGYFYPLGAAVMISVRFAVVLLVPAGGEFVSPVGGSVSSTSPAKSVGVG